jgi:hypothetical protein
MSEHDHLASLRPSRIREVQAGALSWAQVDIIDIGSHESEAVRAGLEQLGVRTRRSVVGQSRHLVAALTEESSADVVLLLCHGDGGDIVLEELADEHERHQPFHGRVTPDDLRGFARLDGRVVIATGCETGDPSLARAFLDCGASAYVAPTGAPFGYASYFAPVFLFYELVEKRSLEEAVARLQRHDGELSMWQLYRP